ncbi:MAG: hypothetical protein V3U92_09290 [Cellulophaga sp.]
MMEKEELIQDYFLGNLSSSNLELFHKYLEEDEKFKAQFEYEKSVQKVIVTKEKKVLKSKLEEFDKEFKISNRKKSFVWKPLSIAATVAVLFTLSWFVYTTYFSLDTEKLYAANYEKYPNTIYSITRGGAIDNSLERKAFQAYEFNHDVKAVELFEKLKKNKDPEYLDFYLAQSYLNSNKTIKAILIFEEIVLYEKEFKTESLWYLSLAYLKNGKLDQTKQTLRKLLKDGSYKKNEAKVLLEKLE